MNVINGDALMIQIALWVLGAIAAAVAATYLLRPKTRALYPGGNGRYLLALIIQASGFLIPIPFVLLFLLGRVPTGADIIIAVLVGIGVIFLLRAIPVTGPLLKDLHRARIEAVLQRLGPRQ